MTTATPASTSIFTSLSAQKRREKRAKLTDAILFNKELQEDADAKRVKLNSKIKSDEFCKQTRKHNADLRDAHLKETQYKDEFKRLFSEGFGSMVAEAAEIHPQFSKRAKIASEAAEAFSKLLNEGKLKVEEVKASNPHFKIYLKCLEDIAHANVYKDEESLQNALTLKNTFEHDFSEVLNKKILAMMENEHQVEALRKEELKNAQEAPFPEAYMASKAKQFNTYFKQILDNTIKENPESKGISNMLIAVGRYGALEAIYTLKLADREAFKTKYQL
jgi:hypothetical protein